jgi:hypothetical protein
MSKNIQAENLTSRILTQLDDRMHIRNYGKVRPYER